MSKQGVRRILLSGTAALTSIGVGIGTAHAQSAGTAAGTTISNQASASYTVNGSPQTTTSNISTFVVDRKVNFTLIADQAANTQVNLNQTGAVLNFKLTNLTNGTQDFLLDADQIVSAGILPGTDNFDVTNVHVYVDKNGNGVYDPLVDTVAYVDELAANASIEIFVVADVPNQANANLAFVDLHATVAAGGQAGTQGTPLIPTDLAVLNTDNTVDIVFADNDSDGVLGLDTVRNGQARAYLAYEVGTHNVALTVVKSSTVISDGVNIANPKALPGATVQYCLTVANATLLTAANGVTLTDVIPANTTYVPGSITVGGVGTGGVCLVGGFVQNDDGTQATGPYTGSFNAATRTVTAGIPTLLGGTSLAASFRVTIN